MTPQNGLFIFLKKETHSETKSWKSSRILTKKSYNNNLKPWKSLRILRVNPFFHFSFFFHHFSMFFVFFSFCSFFSFFSFFHFIIFSIFNFSFFFHFLSFSFMFFHVLSFSFIFFHVLSCSFMFFHVLSCSMSFFPFFLSFSFILFSFLLFHFSLLGAQNLIFFGPSISIRFLLTVVFKKNPLGRRFLFSTLFFLPFFVFFLVFFFFCSFLQFLIYLMFFIFFFIFSEEKSFFFSFFLYISCNFVLLLALVSEFNCFLRSRCSMEMWCLYDIGRDSWDWVGPPAWGRACFNPPQSGVDAPRLFKTVFDAAFNNAFISTSSEHELATPWSPRALTTVSAPKLEKLALNSGTTGGARKMTQNAPKTHHLRHC